MSENLAIRRQKFAKELRRQEVEAYMQTIRERLIKQVQSPHEDMTLTEEQFDQMKQCILDERYSTQSVERFLYRLKKFSTESICTAEVFARFEMAIMHVLQWGKNEGPNQRVHDLAKEILLRAIQCGPNQQGRLPLQYCFKEVLEILSNQSLEMAEIWKAMALVRSQVFLHSSFTEFLCFVENYPDTITTNITPIILEVLVNFTATIEGHQKISISMTHLYHVITKLQLLFQHFHLGESDLGLIIHILENILKLHNFQAVLVLLAQSKIFPALIDALKDSDTTLKSISNILRFLVLALSGPDSTNQRILSKHQDIIPALSKFLPNFKSFTTFQSFFSPNHQWPSFSHSFTLQVLTCYANIASCSISMHLLIKYRILFWYLAFSSYNDPALRAEVAIYLYNSVAICNDEQVELLLEKGLLTGLNNVIREEYGVEAALFGLKTLQLVLNYSKKFPTSNMAWHFSLRTITMYCQKMELMKYLEGLMVCKKPELVHYAGLCLDVLLKEMDDQT